MAEELDTEKINGLLDVILRSKDFPNLSAVTAAAHTELVQLNTELAEAQEEAKKEAEAAAAEEAAAKAEEEKEPEHA